MNPSNQTQDRRSFKRFPARFPARMKDSRYDYGSNIFLRDASAEGFKINSKEQMYLNDKITLEVKLPDDSDPMTLKGEVVWTRNDDNEIWDVGLRFYKIEFMNLARLYKFVAPRFSL